MHFTEQHQQLRQTVRDVINKEINPRVDEWESAGLFPAREVFGQLGALGLLGIDKPEAYGGLGLDFSYHMAFAEELGGIHCGSIPMAVGVQTAMATPALALHGSDELRREFLAPAIAGEQVACIGVSEPNAGSDVAAIRTTARRDGDDYIIDGTKMWITNSTQADFICLLANTDGQAPYRNKSLIIVPTNTPGISFSPRLNKLGMRASDTAQIFFDQVRVPQRYRIGEEGQGFTLQMQQFQEERLFIAASQLRAMEICIEVTQDYVAQREVFGKPLLHSQVIQFRLAELQTEIEACRALVYSATEQRIAGEDVTLLASMCKLKSGRLGREVTDSCLQYWGGQGYMWENLVSRYYRDLRLTSIGGGADEVMLQIICKMMNMP